MAVSPKLQINEIDLPPDVTVGQGSEGDMCVYYRDIFLGHIDAYSFRGAHVFVAHVPVATVNGEEIDLDSTYGEDVQELMRSIDVEISCWRDLLDVVADRRGYP